MDIVRNVSWTIKGVTIKEGDKVRLTITNGDTVSGEVKYFKGLEVVIKTEIGTIKAETHEIEKAELITTEEVTEEENELFVSVSDFGTKANAKFYNKVNGNYYATADFTQPADYDEKAINDAIKYASDNNIPNVIIPAGSYLVNGVSSPDEVTMVHSEQQCYLASGIQLLDNIHLHLDKDAQIVINTTEGSHYSLIVINNKNNVKVSGGQLIGDANTHLPDTNNNCYGINICNGSSNVTISDIDITLMEDDGIRINDFSKEECNDIVSSNIVITNVNSHHNGRQGLTISSGRDITVSYSEFSNQIKNSPTSGIDIEIENYGHIGVKNVTIKNCTFKENAFAAIIISDMFNEIVQSTSENINIESNLVVDCRLGVYASGRVKGLNINENIVRVKYVGESIATAIGTGSCCSTDVIISDNKTVADCPDNGTQGITSFTPHSIIKNNTMIGHKLGMMLSGEQVLENNKFENIIDTEIVRY